MTEKVFYKDPYLKEIKSKIVDINENKVFLDKTMFYPQAGGEPGDKGFIENYRVVDTQKEGDNIAHILETKHELKVGQEVKSKLDWERRHKLMRMHTSAHLLINVCQMLLSPGIKVVGGNIDEDKSRIDLNYEPTITPEIRQNLEKRCNELIQKDLLVKCWWDENKPDYRWTQIHDFPKMPCGGLHVKSLKEIGTFRIVKRESKGKGKQRLEFTVE